MQFSFQSILSLLVASQLAVSALAHPGSESTSNRLARRSYAQRAAYIEGTRVPAIRRRNLQSTRKLYARTTPGSPGHNSDSDGSLGITTPKRPLPATKEEADAQGKKLLRQMKIDDLKHKAAEAAKALGHEFSEFIDKCVTKAQSTANTFHVDKAKEFFTDCLKSLKPTKKEKGFVVERKGQSQHQ